MQDMKNDLCLKLRLGSHDAFPKERQLTSTNTAHQPSQSQQRQEAIARNYSTVFGICRPV